jgi:chorismate-pyruvate lyase
MLPAPVSPAPTQHSEQDYRVFRSKGFSPNWMIGGVRHEHVAMGSLPPFLRTLLVTDGTVTKSLEAYYWEPVVVDTITQHMLAAGQDISALEVESGDEVLDRQVQLRGALSNVIYTRAHSLVRVNRVPERLRQSLLAGSLGIGELIRDCGLETYRELLEIGLADDAAGGPAHAGDVFRTYRIILSRAPTIQVTEYFPISVFREPVSSR